MSIEMLPHHPGLEPAIARFNRRLADGGVEPGLRLPETPDPDWLPGTEAWLAVEGDEVRGGYLLRRHQFSIGGQLHPVAHYRLPLSEGLVNRAYAMLAALLVRDALDREPLLYALGMGGWNRPLPQILQRFEWRMAEVPFYFKTPHPFAVLRRLRALRSSLLRRLACDLAAFSGIGWLAMKASGVARRTQAPAPLEIPTHFAAWSDQVWETSRPNYPIAAVRDAATLGQLYPPENPRFLRLRTAAGWAVVLDTPMHAHKQFGDLRVGTIADCLAPDARSVSEVIRASTRFLEDRGADLIVSNQLHHFWRAALESAGFRPGPSNFLLALSPEFAALATAHADQEIHITRGDGDGPIHL